MDFNLSGEQDMLREAASRFVREQYGFEARRKLAAGPGWSAERWAQYAEMGWLALSIPEECGGMGMSFVETAVVAEEAGRGLLLEPLVGCAVLAVRLLERADAPGFSVRRESLLGGIADGSVQVALAHGESDSRYQLDAAKTTARPSGQGWVLDGTKMMVRGAPLADHLIVSARLEGPSGVAHQGLFLVPVGAVELRPYALIDGTRAADVVLKQVSVDADALLCAPENTLAVLEEALDRASLAHVAEGLGCMEAVIEITSDYLKTRQQFGQTIGKFQALQHRMSEMFVELQETRSALYRGIADLEADAPVRRRAVSAAKVVLGKAGHFVGGQGIQLHGGIGMTDEYQVGHYYSRLLVLDNFYGDAEWHLDRFVESGRELERKAA